MINQVFICELPGLLIGEEQPYIQGFGISNAFDTVWYAVLLQKLKPYRISRWIFVLISFILSNRRLCVVMYGKCSQECQVNVGVPQGSILDPTLFLLCINDPPDGRGGVATFLLLYSSITFTLCVEKVKFSLLLFFLQSFELAVQDSHPSLYSTKTLYPLYISDSFWQCTKYVDYLI